jgi:hypothetical protein
MYRIWKNKNKSKEEWHMATKPLKKEKKYNKP